MSQYNKLIELIELHQFLDDQLQATKEQIDNESSRLADSVTVLKRKESTILTAEDGQQIFIYNRKSIGTETKIYEYHNNTRGKLIEDNVRLSVRRIKIRLANGDI